MEIARAGARRAELYFSGEPDMYEMYKWVRSEILAMLRDLAKQSEEKELGIRRYAQHFEANMRVHLNDFLLGFYSFLKLKEIPEVRRAFVTTAPKFSLKTISEQEFDQQGDSRKHGTVETVGDGFVLSISDSPFVRESYEVFEMLMAHEIVHVLAAQLADHGGALSEGVTQLITERLLGRKPTKDLYGVLASDYVHLVEVAEVLLELDGEGLRTWYATADDFRYVRRLRSILQRLYDPEKAESLARILVMRLYGYLWQLSEKAEEELALDKSDPACREYIWKRFRRHVTMELRKVVGLS